MSDQDELNYEAMLDESMDKHLADMKMATQGKSGKETIADLELHLAEARARIKEIEAQVNRQNNDYLESCHDMQIRHEARVKELEAELSKANDQIMDMQTRSDYDNGHDLNALKAIRADMKELNRDLFGVR